MKHGDSTINHSGLTNEEWRMGLVCENADEQLPKILLVYSSFSDMPECR